MLVGILLIALAIGLFSYVAAFITIVVMGFTDAIWDLSYLNEGSWGCEYAYEWGYRIGTKLKPVENTIRRNKKKFKRD